MMLAQIWVQEMGPSAAMLAEHWLHSSGADHVNHPNKPGYVKDDAVIASVSVWQHKGRESTRAYNEWAIRVTTERIAAVGILFEGSVEQFHAKAEYLVEKGIRSVWLPAGMLPGGRSPAHTDLDPTWKLFAENNVAVCLHTGVEDDVYASREWGNAPAFDGFRLFEEFKLDPWSRVNNYILAHNFLSTMALGGVFERHPMLRFGSLNSAPAGLVRSARRWTCGVRRTEGTRFSDGTAQFLPHPPSYYVKRNVRVSAFDFELVGQTRWLDAMRC